ncbi:glycoside hydrolase family 3 protein [Robiginitalea sediminis]|uniref:glycoside hydrolase family 3 protein n=1 Tax=Robiginitalea sediminis TaxID=1982593 RepID=UPI000B4A8DA5|nr:glycoside hydrolase family 3 N-terminal domain-containing protein [Robiginitalea sediminis]
MAKKERNMLSLPPLSEALAFPLEVQAGQLLMPAAFINDTEAEIQALEDLIRHHHIGGLCFFHSRASAATNFEGKKEIPHNPDSLGTLKALVGRYQAAARYPLLMAIDAEWGLAMRIENGEAYPYALCLGALPPDSPLLYQTGLRMATDLREAGLHWNLAPVADVNNNPANPVIGYRSFGSEPSEVAQKALALSRGMQDGGLLTCAKHYPGHGDTAKDSHLELPVLEKSMASMEACEWIPFRTLIEGGVDAVMTGHLAVPALDPDGMPCSLSAPMIQQTLRKDLGFRGPVITDALNMHAVSKLVGDPSEVAFRALQAGNDLLCFVENPREAHTKLLKKAPAARIREAFTQVWGLKQIAFSADRQPKLPRQSPEALRALLASQTLCSLKESQPAGEIFNAGAFTLVTAGDGLQDFAQALPEPRDTIHWDLRESSGFQLPVQQNVLLAIAPPSLKPAGGFGLSEGALQAIAQLAGGNRLWVCLFGNPYVLETLPIGNAEGILLAYQTLPAFLKQAAAYYRGEAKAPGEVPVTLKIPTS